MQRLVAELTTLTPYEQSMRRLPAIVADEAVEYAEEDLRKAGKPTLTTEERIAIRDQVYTDTERAIEARHRKPDQSPE